VLFAHLADAAAPRPWTTAHKHPTMRRPSPRPVVSIGICGRSSSCFRPISAYAGAFARMVDFVGIDHVRPRQPTRWGPSWVAARLPSYAEAAATFARRPLRGKFNSGRRRQSWLGGKLSACFFEACIGLSTNHTSVKPVRSTWQGSLWPARYRLPFTFPKKRTGDPDGCPQRQMARRSTTNADPTPPPLLWVLREQPRAHRHQIWLRQSPSVAPAPCILTAWRHAPLPRLPVNTVGAKEDRPPSKAWPRTAS